MKIRQAELVDGCNHTIVWIPSKLCKKSQRLTDGHREWVVLHAYKMELEGSEVTRDWRVGGL